MKAIAPRVRKPQARGDRKDAFAVDFDKCGQTTQRINLGFDR